MNAVTLVLPDTIADRMLRMALGPLEAAAVLLTRRARLPNGGFRLIAVNLISVPDEAYLERTRHSLGIASDGYMPALREAEKTGSIAIWVHTHPGDGSSPLPSEDDVLVNRVLSSVFATRTGTRWYGALVIGHQNGRLTFSGHLQAEATAPIDRIFVAGARFALLSSADTQDPPLPDLHDRQIRAFGPEIQHLLGALRIAVVGAGGTGSAVAEQLVRLGIRHLILIDPKRISTSNLTRVYGSTAADVGRPKVDVLGEHLQRVAPGTVITKIEGSITSRAVAKQIVGADLVFCCTDDDAGRLRLSRFSYTYLVPIIDCGIVITSDDDQRIQEIVGRVTVLHPGTACLVCRERISPAVAAAQERDPGDQQRLVAEGYAPALGTTEPAVVAYTTAVAAAAVNELLERLIEYGDSPPPSEVLLLIGRREVRTNDQQPTPRHYCDPLTPPVLGDTDRYWGLGWVS